jgi:UTP--glucose-1-phosphate uridylyltransferase
MGRYILRSEMSTILENLVPSVGREIQLTDGFKKLNELQMVVGCEFDGQRYDVGGKFGFIKTKVEFALHRDDLKGNVLDYLQSVLGKEKVTQ